MKYADLKKYFERLNSIIDGDKIAFRVLLETEEWKKKSDEILKRDNFSCKKCKTEWNPNRFLVNEENGVRLYKIEDYWVNRSDFEVWLDKMKNVPKSEIKVYHKYFQSNKLPWNYPDDALVSLCEKCHCKEHKANNTKLFDENMYFLNNLILCQKCNGSGVLHQYAHIDNGDCFNCKGDGYKNLDLEFNL